MYQYYDPPAFEINSKLFYNPWMNIIASTLGYLSFGMIAYGYSKKRVPKTHMHHVLPLLIFVLLCDVLEMARTLYFICNLKEGTWLITTVTTCTLHFWLSCLHFMLPYVQVVIAIHRFIVGFCGKPLPIYTIYIGLGLVFAAQASFVVADLLFGSTSELLGVPHPVTCSSMAIMQNRYSLKIGFYACGIAEAITIVLSAMHIVKGIVKKEQGSGVAVFILLASPVVLSVLFMIITSRLFGNDNQYILQFFRYTSAFWHFMYVVICHIEDFRLPVLCVFAIIIIKDLREAVRSAVSEAIHETFDRKKISTTIGYEIHVETGVKKQMLEDIQP